MDDISHPQHLYLNDIWDRIIDNDHFLKYSFRDLGYGISFAIKLK